jgi:hypothetical protein
VGYDGAAGVDNFGSAAVRLTETAPVPALGNLGLGLLIGLLTLAGGFAIRRAR